MIGAARRRSVKIGAASILLDVENRDQLGDSSGSGLPTGPFCQWLRRAMRPAVPLCRQRPCFVSHPGSHQLLTSGCAAADLFAVDVDLMGDVVVGDPIDFLAVLAAQATSSLLK